MSERAHFISDFRERLKGVQSRTTARFETFNADARKAFDEFVKKGRESQRDLQERLNKVSASDYRIRVETIGRKVKDAQGRAVHYMDSTSREQAAAVAENLRRMASRIDQVARRAAEGNTSATAAGH